MDGVLNPKHVNGKHIVNNVFNVNKTGIVVLENKDGTVRRLLAQFVCFVVQEQYDAFCPLLSPEDMPYWVVSAMKCLANCK